MQKTETPEAARVAAEEEAREANEAEASRVAAEEKAREANEAEAARVAAEEKARKANEAEAESRCDSFRTTQVERVGVKYSDGSESGATVLSLTIP